MFHRLTLAVAAFAFAATAFAANPVVELETTAGVAAGATVAATGGGGARRPSTSRTSFSFGGAVVFLALRAIAFS